VQMQFDPQSRRLLAVSRDRTWSLHLKGADARFTLEACSGGPHPVHSRIVWSCAWTHDSLCFATGSRDGKLALWAEDSGKEPVEPVGRWGPAGEPLHFPNQSVTAVAFAPRLVDGGYFCAIGLEAGTIDFYAFKGLRSERLLHLPQGVLNRKSGQHREQHGKNSPTVGATNKTPPKDAEIFPRTLERGNTATLPAHNKGEGKKRIVELLVTADNPWKGTGGTYTEYFLMTFNFDSDVDTNLATMEQLQPGRPLMVMEYWSGWFDYVASGHKTKTLETFQATYEPILARPASVNMYMFIGGTSWGFLSGSQNLAYDDLNTRFTPMTTSYDYSAPLAENGDYTDKYWLAQQLLAQYNPIKTLLPAPPALQGRVAYPSLSLQGQLSLEALIGRAPAYDTPTPVSMENMDINNGSGQSYGFVVYRRAGLRLPEGAQLTIEGRVCDTVIVLVNGRRVSPLLQKAADLDQFGTWRTANSSLTLNGAELEGAQLDLVVENWGRANVGVYRQYKGLWQGGVTINNEPVTGWTMHALEFKRAWTNGLDGWEAVAAANEAPTLYRATLQVEGGAADTYVYMEEWTKGIVVVNGFVLGRYARIGPQQSLYLPAPFLREGANDILIFELFEAADLVQFATDIVYNNH
ncbi:hypothetical protein HUJ04_000036, partial [Dendroctonus ponderosae]